MKKTKAILIAAVVFTMANVCWGQSYWKRTYGGAEDVSPSAITPTSDGNFIIGGYTETFNDTERDVYLLKITSFGDMLWTKTFSGNHQDWASAITSTADGNFLVAGYTDTSGVSDGKIYLLKITSSGDILWTRTYGSASSANAITPTSDGDFIVAGLTWAFGLDSSNVYILKIKPNGDTLWTKTYGETGNNGATAIVPTLDGNFIVIGNTTSFGAENWNIYILKIPTNGDTLWTKTYKGSEYYEPFAITQTSDRNFIIAGNSYSSSVEDGNILLGNSNIYLMKIAQNGDTLWTKTYGDTGVDYCYTITQTPDGNFIVTGYTVPLGDTNGVVYLLKIKPNGDTLWTKTYGKIGNYFSNTITPTPDGNFILAGNTISLSDGRNEIWLLSIIDDRYAKKDSLFTFKIPVSGDSLNHGYSPLKVPSGMIVSPGGTISWTPKTDSVYMDHAEFLVSDDFGNKDTLTFNIFVNSSNNPTAIKTLSRPILNKNQAFSITQTSSSQIKFSLPSGTTNIDIFDINGRCVQRLNPAGAQAVWNGLNAAGSPVSSGRYFAKIKEGKTSRLGQFTVVR